MSEQAEVAKATRKSLSGSRQITVRYRDTMEAALALAYLSALVTSELISLSPDKERKLNRVFRSMDWRCDNSRTVIITFTKKFDIRNIDLFSQKLARHTESVEVLIQNIAPTTKKQPSKGKKSCRK